MCEKKEKNITTPATSGNYTTEEIFLHFTILQYIKKDKNGFTKKLSLALDVFLDWLERRLPKKLNPEKKPILELLKENIPKSSKNTDERIIDWAIENCPDNLRRQILHLTQKTDS